MIRWRYSPDKFSSECTPWGLSRTRRGGDDRDEVGDGGNQSKKAKVVGEGAERPNQVSVKAT